MDKKIKEIVSAFLEKMLIFEAKIKVQKNEEIFEIKIDCSDPGILIGKNGETMRAMEQLLRLVVSKKMEAMINLVLDIADYREKRRLEIEEMAKRAAKSAAGSGQEQILIPMNAFERRIVHLILSKYDDLETESLGEEPNRRVVIKVKEESLV